MHQEKMKELREVVNGSRLKFLSARRIENEKKKNTKKNSKNNNTIPLLGLGLF